MPQVEMMNTRVWEKARTEKLKDLGLLCYNLYVNKAFSSVEINRAAGNIKDQMTSLMLAQNAGRDETSIRRLEDGLNGMLTELGCFCYNSYVDGKPLHPGLLSVCRSFAASSIQSVNGKNDNGANDSGAETIDASDRAVSDQAEESFESSSSYEMEPIPVNFKLCPSCGYRNKNEAWFCGKCGAKLP